MKNKLKHIRIKNNLTTAQTSEKLNISAPFYNQIENKKRRLSYDMAVKIANIFKTKPDDLFYEDYKSKQYK